jgi:hypothetical protein
MTLEQTWLDNDLHNLRWRYIHAVTHAKDYCLLLEDPIRTSLGLVGESTHKAVPPGTPSCYKRVVRVSLAQLQHYIDRYSYCPAHPGVSNANR